MTNKDTTWEEKLRCSKCNNPFEPHHWQHFAPKTGEIFHTGCFEQYKFPALLAQARAEAIKERVVPSEEDCEDPWTCCVHEPPKDLVSPASSPT